jgi:hypothetical protein
MSHDGMNEKEYKKMFGFDLGKGICSKESSMLSSNWNALYRSKVVEENLLKKGVKTRFEKGSKGRTKDKISPATMKRLKQQSFIKKSLIQ